MSMILNYLGLEEISNEETLRIIYGDAKPAEASEKLQKWLLLLPDSITAQIHAALRQERPFLPPDITPEMMAAKNSIVASMTQIDILYRCVDLAFQAKDFNMAACLAYVVDRATYWSGASEALLRVVDLIKQADPLVAIAPQIQVRKARVLKDEGDLHGAMKVLNDILARRQDQPGEWRYVDEDQYVTTKAEIIKIKGHILYNMGMFKDSVEPFLDSIKLFASLQEKDEKGIASCLGLLTKCLGRLSLKEFKEVKEKFPDSFKKDHPCLESYVQGIEAVKHIESLQESLYSSRHTLDADTSLLKYAILSPSLGETYELLNTILVEMRTSVGAHKTVDTLGSSEQFFEFVRALFMISLALAFSPVQQDRNVAEYIQQLSMELYLHLCNHNKVQRVTRLSHTAKSVKFMNASLSVLGLPSLLGVLEEEQEITSSEEGRRSDIKQEPSKCGEISEKMMEERKEVENIATRTQDGQASDLHHNLELNHLNQTKNKGISKTVDSNVFSSSALDLKPAHAELNKTADTDRKDDGRKVNNSRKEKTFRGWTYNFGHETRAENVYEERQVRRTFPLVNQGTRPLDPKKQWQTYKHKCVGLPVDPNFFASPVPSHKRQQLWSAEHSSTNEDKESSASLVNLSVPYIKQTVENRTNSAKPAELVDRGKSTVLSTSSVDYTERTPLHPHDLPNQPMKRQRDDDTSNENDDVDASRFAPLVDLAKTTMSDVLEASVGESASTNDAVEYMNSWKPPTKEEQDGGNGIQRAFVLNYNPKTSDWTGQSTLAFLGEELDLTEDKKGNCRDAFHVQFLHQDEPRGRYVGKRYRNERHHHPTRYMQDVVCQMMAGYYVTKFNEAMQNYKRDIQVQFLPAAHLQLLNPYGQLEDCINVEPYLHGDFIKLTNNFAYADMQHHGKELATALSHFSYCESEGHVMIVDIQGWLPREGTGVIYLTDPQFHTVGLEKFSPYDYQEVGMKKFWESVHPRCNDMCRAIGLERSQE